MRYTNENYLEKCIEVHNNFYSYPNGVNINNIRFDYINVRCPIHGDFKVRADHHKSGIKCRKCNQGNDLGIFTKKLAQKNIKKWSKIDSHLYFLELKNDNELFYKVGVTTIDLKKRLKEFPKNYNIEIIGCFNESLYRNVISEADIMEDFYINKYEPIQNFRGKTECFSLNMLESYYN